MEYDPERGRRCSMCFDMRFVRTALYAHENNFKVITVLWELAAGRIWNRLMIWRTCCEPYDDVKYWTFNWRKDGGAERMYKHLEEEEFYQQQYCGCIYSLVIRMSGVNLKVVRKLRRRDVDKENLEKFAR